MVNSIRSDILFFLEKIALLRGPSLSNYLERVVVKKHILKVSGRLTFVLYLLFAASSFGAPNSYDELRGVTTVYGMLILLIPWFLFCVILYLHNRNPIIWLLAFAAGTCLIIAVVKLKFSFGYKDWYNTVNEQAKLAEKSLGGADAADVWLFFLKGTQDLLNYPQYAEELKESFIVYLAISLVLAGITALLIIVRAQIESGHQHFCTHCGEKLALEAEFCTACGQPKIRNDNH